MKIILAACNAKYIHSNLAVYDLQAYARQYQQHILLKEYTINQQKDEIMKDLYEEKPDVICFSCYIWNISFIKELAEDLKKVLPSVPFWAGGPEVSFDAEAFLAANPAFDGVMVGEGEETFLELAGYYVDHGKAWNRSGGSYFVKKTRFSIMDGEKSWILARFLFHIRICRILTIGSFIMKAAGAVLFHVATACLL